MSTQHRHDAPELLRKIRGVWPRLREDELERTGGDLDRVASLIAERYGEDVDSPPSDELARVEEALAAEIAPATTSVSSDGPAFRTWHPDTYDARRLGRDRR